MADERGGDSDDILHVEDPIAVGGSNTLEYSTALARVRLWELVIGVTCHTLRLGAMAPLMIALMVTSLLAMTITETHDEILPRVLGAFPESVQQSMQDTLDDESLGWDDIGKRMAAPFLMGWFFLSFLLSAFESLTGWHLYTYAPKLWHWLVVLVVFFAGMTYVTVTNVAEVVVEGEEASRGLIFAVVGTLNLFLAGMASFSAIAMKAVNMAEQGSVEAIRKSCGLVEVQPAED